MTLRGRIAQLESRRGNMAAEAEAAGATERLCMMLGRIEAAVRASGDFSHDPNASPAENTVRAWLRGETELGDALRDLVAGRFP